MIYTGKEREQILDKFDYFRNINRHIFDKNLEYEQKISRLYSIAINQPTIYNNYTDRCEKLCLEYIEFFPTYKQLENDYNNFISTLYEDNYIFRCSAIETLAKLYEKQERYIDAIKICIRGSVLEEGENHVDSIYNARIGRIIKKYNKLHKDKPIEFDYDNLELFY